MKATSAFSPLTPEGSFWRRYSPHGEFPLSTLTSALFCALAAGLVLLASLFVGLARHSEQQRPPQMDLVEIAGGGGTEGSGGEGPGSGGPAPRAENVPASGPASFPSSHPKLPPPPKLTNPQEVPIVSLPAEIVSGAREVPDDPLVLQKLTQEAQRLQEQAQREIEQALRAGQAGKEGKQGSAGSGGGEGGGKGTGRGKYTGAGRGTQIAGQVLTRRQRRELRWKINFSGSGEEHLAKLKALGITLVLPAGQGVFQEFDLSRMPPTHRLVKDLHEQANKIKWYNTYLPSLRELARVLHLSAVPPYAVIFLPAALEEEMIRLEHDYQGLEEDQIELTEFEIQRRPDGSVGPVVVRQIARSSRKR